MMHRAQRSETDDKLALKEWLKEWPLN